MQTDAFSAGSVLSWQRTRDAAAHQAELRRSKHTWIALPSALLQTRYQLNATDLSFGNAETATTIQSLFRDSQLSGGIEFNQYYLIAEPHAAEPCYNISDYVQRCVAGDLTIAERLRGRTVINLYQTEGTADDLLSDQGVSQFIERLLRGYLKTHGKQHLIGFTCEPPKFLSLTSVLGAGTSSVPWSPVLLEAAEVTLAAYLPLVFYETYNSGAVRNTFWQALTTRFATCFLQGLRDFCHQEGLRFALNLSASAKTLEFELGSMLAEVDFPILNTTEIDTPKRFVVAKWACSNTQHAGIARKKSNKTDARTPTSRLLEDASLGFNLWMNRNSAADSVPQGLAIGYPKRPILMIAPTQSLWTKPDEKSWSGITKAWGWLCQSVWELGYDFRIVSEQELGAAEIIDAAVARKRGCKRGGLCFPNNGTDTREIYNVVLLPSCISLQEETVKRLKAFTKAKGRLIVDEPTPYLLNGQIGLEPYPLEQLIFGRRTTILRGPPDEKAVKLEKRLGKWVPRIVSVYVKPENDPTDSVLVLHREAEASEIFYLFNTSSEPMETLIEIQRKAARVSEFDLFQSKKESIAFWHADEKTYLNSVFTPKQGRLFVVS
ncbi:hypothetical protein F4054_22220 [Candidatus Poribacteria bacterium]|nr:hypothetical protein [Candidatus Poribacteria bacterium]MYG06444.1 hypothetical protein [Candidatus Poribacteria bacterium]MYK24967.1 hypothetical protein [Candidatus Poribacteria bacterium]